MNNAHRNPVVIIKAPILPMVSDVVPFCMDHLRFLDPTNNDINNDNTNKYIYGNPHELPTLVLYRYIYITINYMYIQLQNSCCFTRLYLII